MIYTSKENNLDSSWSMFENVLLTQKVFLVLRMLQSLKNSYEGSHCGLNPVTFFTIEQTSK